MSSVFVYDPTGNDPLSKVRGVGRYLQILRENFPQNTIFTDNVRRITSDSIFINPFYNFLQKPLTFKRIAKKQIAVIHDLIPLKYPEHFPAGIKGKLNIFLNKLAIRNYDVIVTDSEASKKNIIDILYIKEERIKVIYPCLPNIFDKVDSSKKLVVRDKNTKNPSYQLLTTNYCLYVGDATWNKNLVNLAKAIKIINVTCVFVGKVFKILKQVQDDNKPRTSAVFPSLRSSPTAEVKFENGWQKDLHEFIQLTNNDKRFVFLGYVPDQQLIQLYRQAKCNILVSRDEGFGFSYLEAASRGCPSVLADIPVLHEVSNNQGVLFAKPYDTNDIANTIGEVYFNQDLKIKKGEEARTRSKFFSYSKFVDSLNNICKL